MAFNYYTIIAGFIIGIVLFFRMPILLKAKAGERKREDPDIGYNPGQK